MAPAPAKEQRVAWPAAAHPLPQAGEVAAAARLAAFAARIDGYRDERDRPDLDATSRLSPDLRVGAVSARACWRVALEASAGALRPPDGRHAVAATAWRRELAWRELFAHLLAISSRLAAARLRPEFDQLAWTAGDERMRRCVTGRPARPGTRLSTRACASWRRPDGCPTARGW